MKYIEICIFNKNNALEKKTPEKKTRKGLKMLVREFSPGSHTGI